MIQLTMQAHTFTMTLLMSKSTLNFDQAPALAWVERGFLKMAIDVIDFRNPHAF